MSREGVRPRYDGSSSRGYSGKDKSTSREKISWIHHNIHHNIHSSSSKNSSGNNCYGSNNYNSCYSGIHNYYSRHGSRRPRSSNGRYLLALGVASSSK